MQFDTTAFDIRHDGIRHSTSTLRFDKRNSTRFAIDGIRRQSTAFDIIFKKRQKNLSKFVEKCCRNVKCCRML